MTFIKKKEDFTCEHCQNDVSGNGFTNHCPKCLYSKHVDVSPGDRLSECHGMMRPIKFEKEKDQYVLTHKCEKCGYEKRNKMSANDDFDKAVKIIASKL